MTLNEYVDYLKHVEVTEATIVVGLEQFHRLEGELANAVSTTLIQMGSRELKVLKSGILLTIKWKTRKQSRINGKS